MNHKIVMLFCISGLPLRVLDTPQWKRLMETVTKFKYELTSSTMVSGTFIPAEVALVRSHQVAFLQMLVNLTITFDGGSTRKLSSVYTIHISTADRECFFMEGHDATDEKHTAAYIESLITSVRVDPCTRHGETHENAITGCGENWPRLIYGDMFRQSREHEECSPGRRKKIPNDLEPCRCLSPSCEYS